MLCGIPGGHPSQEWGAAETPSFRNFPGSGSSPSVERVQFTCVFHICFKLCSSRTCPMPNPSPLRSCGKNCFYQKQKRMTGGLLQGPPLPRTAALPAPWQPGMKATPTTCAEGPTVKVPDARPHSWRFGVPEAQIKVAGCPWAAVCTNFGHKSKLKITIL